MLVSWMVYGILLGVVFAGGAALLEWVARAYGRESRKVWIVAMAGAVFVPLAAWVGVGPGASEFAAETFRNAGTIVMASEGLLPEAILLSGVLGFAWVCGSVVLASSFLMELYRVHRDRQGWGEGVIGGSDVLISDDVGPAVVGFRKSRVVVPAWVLEAEESVGKIILAHEEEHRRAGDPKLLLLGMLAVFAMPWNLPLWWMLQRMRLAIEVDCDDRVLREGEWDVRTYGALLLSVGQRRNRASYSFAAFSFPKSTLEHRILAMTRRGPKGRAVMATGLLLATAGLLFMAWSLPSPKTLAHWSASGYWCDAPSSDGVHGSKGVRRT